MGETRICVRVCVYATLVVVAVIALEPGESVEWRCLGPLAYYNDLECKPVYRNKYDYCAYSYNCNHMKMRSRNKCYINSHEYKHGQSLKWGDANICDQCVCQDAYDENEIAAFECFNIKCPDIKPKRGCYLRRDPTECCQDPQEICPKKLSDRPVCVVDGFVYLDGETFDVKEQPELTCICRPGYKGKNIPPFCVKYNHSPWVHPAFSHVDYFRQNCAPIFFNLAPSDNAYYTNMRCPFANDSIRYHVNNLILRKESWEEECLFGNLTLRIGDTVHPDPVKANPCVKCTCEVPPVLSCKYMTQEACKANPP